ncbi:MAG: PEGA domain-containing protein, partial [Thermoanaerobaculia bacterium]|nr:PEGA domain-containing protein [Thermoanaerobaculia bacterium]
YGALDTDVSPERAEVWLDGRKIGVADDFDGFPNYLWLEKGTYDVVFYRPGFQTIARQYSIYPGLVIDVEDRMEAGEAVHPLDLESKSRVRRDERLRRDRERRESAAGTAPQWAPEERREGAGEPWLDARAEPGRLRLEVAPGDASVYLDGRFVGTGDDLARLRAGLLVDSGRHTLEIVRPGYGSVEREVEVESGEEAELRLELQPLSAGEP